MVRVTKVIPLDNNRLKLTFSTQQTAECDITDLIVGPKFSPLAERGFFNHVAIDELGGIFWLNGADLCPEFLYRRCFPGESSLDG